MLIQSISNCHIFIILQVCHLVYLCTLTYFGITEGKKDNFFVCVTSKNPIRNQNFAKNGNHIIGILKTNLHALDGKFRKTQGVVVCFQDSFSEY